MRLPRNPTSRNRTDRIRTGAAMTAVLAGAALVLAATPALAAPAGADVAFKVAGERIVRMASKPFYVHVTNQGPATAENVVVKVDVAELNTDKLRIDPPVSCDVNGTVYTCPVGSLDPGENNMTFSPFDVTSLERTGPEPDPAGYYTIEVTSDTPDPDPDNNEPVKVLVDVAPVGYDLQTYVQDVWANPVADEEGHRERVAPAATAPLFFFFYNGGSQTADHVVWQVSLPAFTSFATDGNPDYCRYNEKRTVATCRIQGTRIAPRTELKFDAPMLVTVAADAPGPVALSGGIVDAGGTSHSPAVSAQVAAQATATVAAAQGVRVGEPDANHRRRIEADPADNLATFAVHTAANPADLAITGGSGSGAVGATVNIQVTAANEGPASSPATTVRVTAPTGTELADLPTGCEFETAGKVAKCQGLLEAGDENTGTFVFKILSNTVGTDGKAEISGTLDDPDETNNSSPITITVSGGLPITGTRVSLISGVGVAVLAAGIALFMLSRRRRVVLVTPADDA
jgi:hypothetical protein